MYKPKRKDTLSSIPLEELLKAPIINEEQQYVVTQEQLEKAFHEQPS